MKAQWKGALGVVAISWLLTSMAVAPAGATYLPHERIPTDSPVYRDLERLAARFALSPRFLSMRPLRLIEAREFLRGIAGAHAEVESDPAWLRAMRYLDVESRGALRPLISVAGDEGEALEVSPHASFIYSDDPRNTPGINRDYRAGVALAAALDSTIFVIDAYAGTASQGGRGTPNFGTLNSLVEDVDGNTWFEEAYVEFPVSRMRVLAGHTWLRWGPGREGTLALSDAAPALDMLKGEVTAFRNWRLQWFVALLDPGLETYLAGHRLEATLSPRLTVGFTEAARFDGTSQALLYWIPLVPYSFWEKRPKTAAAGSVPGDTSGVALAKNNVLWSADVAWSAARAVRLWGELMVDDISFSSDYKPDMIGYQAGIEARRGRGGGVTEGGAAGDRTAGALGAVLEYTRVHNFTYSAWHGHHFEHQDFPTGFVLGPDVASVAAEVAYEHSVAWEFRVRTEWRKKGAGSVGDPWDPAMGEVDASEFAPPVEWETRISGSIIYAPARWLRAEAYAGGSWTDYGGATETPIRLAASVQW